MNRNDRGSGSFEEEEEEDDDQMDQSQPGESV